MIKSSMLHGVAALSLNDPARRNALSSAMFDALEGAIARVREDDSIRAVLLRGEGPAFCAGFDLAAAVEHRPLMATFIGRLSRLLRAIRRLPRPVVAAVHGAAIAGGCAIVSACDIVFVEQGAKLGYPVHRIGVSPAVTLPTLSPKVGHGAARALVMSGDLIDGREAGRIGLASHVVEGVDAMHAAAADFVRALARKPPNALRVTKRWINELDGSLEDAPHEGPVSESARLATGGEAASMLRAAWSERG